MADNFFVTAVLVAHDGSEWLPEVIASLFAQSRKIDRIVAVDNGSLDGSAKLISNAGITLIKSDRESGFGDAIDLALDRTKPVTEDKEELIWLLHDDCALSRTARPPRARATLSRAVAAARARRSRAAAHP